MVVAAPPAISFFVAGQPVTKGSLRPWHRFRADGGCLVRLSEQTDPKLTEWRALIATAAKRAMRQEMPFAGPVRVELNFLFPRPKKQHPLEAASLWVSVRGRYDIDKLSRACMDALTDSAIWQDDSQAARLYAGKRYAGPGERPGVYIEVEVLT